MFSLNETFFEEKVTDDETCQIKDDLLVDEGDEYIVDTDSQDADGSFEEFDKICPSTSELMDGSHQELTHLMSLKRPRQQYDFQTFGPTIFGRSDQVIFERRGNKKLARILIRCVETLLSSIKYILNDIYLKIKLS